MDESSATEHLNYSVTGDLQFLHATLSADKLSVTLVIDPTTPMIENTSYTVTVNSVTDKAGNEIVAPDNEATFRSFVLSRGFMNFAAYNTGGGNAVSLLTTHPSYPDNPYERLYPTAFDSRTVYPDSSHEGFGARITGVFIPPASGNWIFYMSADDDAELWVNPNGSQLAGTNLLIQVPSCCQGFSAHSSTPVPLTAGERYFVMALYKEGTGGDYCRVAAKLESDPTNPDNLQPIPGEFLGCYVDPAGASLSIAQQPTNTTGVVPVKVFQQNFAGSDGAFSAVISGSSPTGGWAYDAVRGTWYANGDDSGPTSSTLTGPPITITSAEAMKLTIKHRYSFEYDGSTRWDGGQIRLSTDGGPFNQVASNAFLANGYVGLIEGNSPPINGQWGFNDISPGAAGGAFIDSVIDLGTRSVGSTLDLMADGAHRVGSSGVENSGVVAVHSIAGCPCRQSRKNVPACDGICVLIHQCETNKQPHHETY